MSEFSYRGFVQTLAQRVLHNLATIETTFNFEYGDEFEVALCQSLRSALPDRYGVARGYAVNEHGNTAGDDIFIYERSRFPTLTLRHQDDFSRKEYIPIEAIYAYVEAKHTLQLTGDGPQSLRHACEQVSSVKALCGTRPAIDPDQIGPYSRVQMGIRAELPKDFPTISNPAFGIVFARQVRKESKSPVLSDPREIDHHLAEQEIDSAEAPDLVVLGEHNLVLPALPSADGSHYNLRSPFYIPGRSVYHTAVVDGVAFGIAFLSIFAALDWIQLGVMPWHRIIVNGLGIPFE